MSRGRRLDAYVAETFSYTRNRAQFLISQQLVRVNGVIRDRNAFEVLDSDRVEIEENEKASYVSRSALKLEDFLRESQMDIRGAVCLDVGASTGGFTQVLLSRGASEVYCLDVGTSQLHPSLRGDPRVVSIENTDIRALDPKSVPAFGVVTVDVSFISLRKIMGAILAFASQETAIILLFKPQFEVGKEHLRKSGVPKDWKTVLKSLEAFKDWLEAEGVKVCAVLESSLPGEAGNREFLLSVRKSGQGIP